MFNFDKAETPITSDEILSKISQKQIFEYYCQNFNEIDKPFLSEFYNDTKPSCRIFIKPDNNLAYKDFGTGEYYNCFNYICRKYGCNYHEALRIIANDFKIKQLKINISPLLVLNSIELPKGNKKVYKSKIEIVSQPYNLTDYNYWNSYKIPLSLLVEYNVFSCKYIYLHKSDKTTIFEYTKNNPIYAYRFTNNGEYHYKIYKPLEQDKRWKWLFSGSKDDIEGYYQLPLFGDILILTKSLKDCMCYNICGYPAISLQGEANKFDIELKNKLLKRFKTIVVNYDNDIEGIRGSKRIMQETGFKCFYIDEAKDLSDYMKNHTIEEAKIMINNKINELL